MIYSILSLLFIFQPYSSNPKMQYQLFMKATQLDVITQRLDECILIIRSSKVKLQSHMQSHAALQKQQDAIDCKVKQFQSMEPLRVS